MVEASPRVLEGTRVEPITISQSDFDSGPYDGSQLDAQEVGQVGRVEIGDDGSVFSAYEFVRLGQALDRTQNSSQGKIYGDVRDGGDAAVDPRTELRFVVQPKNQNHRTPLTQWYSVRDLDRDDPRQRYPLPPVTRNGNPAYAKDGRILALEARNASTAVTIDLTNCDMEIPARARY